MGLLGERLTSHDGLKTIPGDTSNAFAQTSPLIPLITMGNMQDIANLSIPRFAQNRPRQQV